VLVGLPLVFVKFVQQFALSLLRLVVVVLILVVLKPLVLIFLPLSDLVVVVVENFLLVVYYPLLQSHLRLNHLLTAGAGQTRAGDLIDDVMAGQVL